MYNFREKYLKYKNKYLSLKNQKGGSNIRVNVQNMAGGVLTININPCDTTIGEFKRRIHELDADLDARRQRLMIKNPENPENPDDDNSMYTELDNYGSTLASCGIENDSTVYIFIRPYEEGEYLRSFESKGSADGQIMKLLDLCINSEGELFITDKLNGVQIFEASTGQYLRSIPKDSAHNLLKDPHGVCVSAINELFVVDRLNCNVQVFDAKTGAHLRNIGSYGYGDGELVQPRSVCLSDNGELFVTEPFSHRVQVFNANTGEFMRIIGTTFVAGNGDNQLNLPSSVCVSAKDELFVVDRNNSRIQVFRASNSDYLRTIQMPEFNRELHKPIDVCVTSTNKLFVSYNLTKTVEVFDADTGNHLYTIGGQRGNDEGQFNQLHGICLSPDDKELFVVDSSNHRVQVFAI